MPGLGFTADDMSLAREGLVLVRALVPEGFDFYLSQIEHGLDDPVYVSLLRRCWHAGEWGPDDPRVDELATAMADYLVAEPSLLAIPAGRQACDNGATRYGVQSAMMTSVTYAE